jgi:EAL domain-containing protein (putative c-di-GMP-specific phosphodiesterase class I)
MKSQPFDEQEAVDDFGIGYSSRKHLRNFPAQKLKTAKESVFSLPEDWNDTVIVRATIGLAKDMQMMVIAEGAEMVAWVESLRALRCNQVQGFCFNRLLTPQDASDFLKKIK